MGLWSSVRRLFGSSKEPGGRTATTLYSMSALSAPFLRRGTIELFRAYETSPYFRMVQRRLAHERATAVRKHRVLFDGPDDDPERKQIKRDDVRYEVMRALRRPVLMSSGQKVTQYQRNKILALWYGLAGEAFAAKLRDPKSGRVIALVPISPLWIQATPTRDDPNYTVMVSADLAPKKIPASEIIPYVEPTAENPYGRGCGDGASLGYEIDCDDGIAKMSRAIIANQGSPQGVVLVEGANTNQLKEYRENWRQRFGGPSQAGQIEFLGGKASFIPLQHNEIFKEGSDARKNLRDMMCHVCGVTPEVLGILDGSTRESQIVAEQSFAKAALVPWLELVTDTEQAHLVGDFVPNPEDACLGYDSCEPDDRDLQVRLLATAPSAFRGADARKVGGFAPDAELDAKQLGQQPQKATTTQLPGYNARGARVQEAAWALALKATEEVG